MRTIAQAKKQRIMDINEAVHNNLKRLVRKQKLHKFADLSDALPSDIRQHLEKIESRTMDRIEASPNSYSRRSKVELLASPRNLSSESIGSLSSRRKSMTTMSASDILTKIFDDHQHQDDERAFQAERSANLLNFYRGWDGMIGITILMESVLIWFRICFYSAYRDDAQFQSSFILWSLLIEYILETLFLIDIFAVKLRTLPMILNCNRVQSKTFSFYWDILTLCPFELLLIIPWLVNSPQLYWWMVWCRFPKLLRLRSFQWSLKSQGKNQEDPVRNEMKKDSAEIYQYSSSFNERMTNLEKFMSYYAVPIFVWRYMSFVTAYLIGAHIMGGLWYLVGLWGESYYSLTWIIRDRSKIFVEGYENGSFVVMDMYLRSIYFCLNAMTTTGYGDIACTNPLETVFLVVLIIVSIIMFASMVGLFQNKTMEKDAHLARCVIVLLES